MALPSIYAVIPFTILQAPPAYRLPALYVLDSICKNVGAPYTDLWASRIYNIFMETYRVVDHAVKVRMEELLNTWREAGPNRTPLFGAAAQQSIERSLWGQSGPPSHMQQPRHQQLQQQSFAQATLTPPHNVGAMASAGDVNGMLGRFDRLIATCSHDQRYNPHLFDATRMEALTKLRGIVATTPLSPAELSQIAAQLDSLEGEMQGRTPQIHSPPHKHAGTAYRATPPLQHPQSMRSPPHNPSASAIPPSLAGALANLSKLTGNLTPPSHQSTPPPTTQQPVQPKPSGSAFDLVASLRQAGLLPANVGAAIVNAGQDADYCQLIKGMDLRLTTIDLQRELPFGSLDAIASKELPLQCRQCANRYPSGPKGQASLDKHLDWHFRQNRRAKDSAVRGQSRAWFSKLDEWVRGGHDDTAPAKRGEDSAERSAGTALTPAQEAELKAATKAFVVAPTDDPDAAMRPCPICKELFKSEWSEDEEEWLWKNCVKVDGTYYHGSCHYSAKTLSNAVGRLVNGDGSRDVTPQPSTADRSPQADVAKATGGDAVAGVKDEQSVATVQSTGTKRKVSPVSGDEAHNGSGQGTPVKRVALTVNGAAD